MSPDGPSQEELTRIESELLERLNAAKHAYLAAKQEATKLYQVRQDIGLSNPDGRAAVRNAARMEREMFLRFKSALQEFNDLILRYKLPRDLP